jgi:hypothetical protein
MSNAPTVAVPEPTDLTFDELLAELAKPERSHVHIVKVDDQGMVEPTRKGKAFVMQPMVRVVVTALDYTKPEILRFQKTWEVGSGAASIDPTGTKTRDQITAAIEARGLQVSQGEWTQESASAALQGVKV